MKIQKRAKWILACLLSAVAVLLAVWSGAPAAEEGVGRVLTREGAGRGDAVRLRRAAERRSQREARAALQREARETARRGRARNGARSGRGARTPGERKRQEQERFVKRILAENAKEDGFSVDDRAFLEILEEAEQADDIDLVADAAQAALKSGNRELRLAAVEALATFGESGIPELADFIADPDPEVAAMAVDRYEMGLQDVEDEAEVAVYAKLAAMSLKDESQLDLMLSQIQMVSDELVAVQAMADLISEGGDEVSAAARRLYEDYTGEEWTGFDDAEKWLRENYEPEDPDEGEGA